MTASEDKLFTCAFRDGLNDEQFDKLSKNCGTCFELSSRDKMFKILFKMFPSYRRTGMTLPQTDRRGDNSWKTTWMLGYGFSVIDDDEGHLVVGGPIASWDKKGFNTDSGVYHSTGNIGLVKQKNVLQLPAR